MKKYLIAIILSLVIIPQITLASWWNPITWKVFSRPAQTKVQSKTIVSTPIVATSSSQAKKPVTGEKIKADPASTKAKNLDLSKYGIPASPISKVTPTSNKPEYLTKKWTEKEFRDTFYGLIELGMYAKDDIYIWFNFFHKNADGTYTRNEDGVKYPPMDQTFLKTLIAGIPNKKVDGLSDEQKIKLTISANEVLDSFENSINLEKRVTNEYIAIYDQKSSVSNEVLSHCEQGKITDQSLMESQKQRFLNQMASRGQLDGWSGANQLIAEEEARERQYVDNNYRQCVLMTQSLNVPRINYKTELQDWLNRLDTFNKMASSLRNGLNDGVTSVAEMQDLKQGFEVLDTNFSRERTSIDSLRRTIAQSSPVNYDLQRQLQDSIDRTKKELENPFGYTDITCKPGITSSYECSSLRGSSPFSCNVNQYGFVTCATRSIR